MKTRYLALVLVIVLVLTLLPAAAGAEQQVDGDPYVTINIFGFADRDGRVTLRMVRRYHNPEGRPLVLTEGLQYGVNWDDFTDVKVVSKSAGIATSFGPEREVIFVHIDSEAREEYVELEYHFRPGYGRTSIRNKGEALKYSRIIYNGTLPLRYCNIIIELPQTAVGHDQSALAILYPGRYNELETLRVEPIIDSNFPTIKWELTREEISQLARAELVSLEVWYLIPDAVRHVWYVVIMSVLALVAFALVVFTLRFHNRLVRLERKQELLK